MDQRILVILSQTSGNGGIPRFNRNVLDGLKDIHEIVEVVQLLDGDNQDYKQFASKLVFKLLRHRYSKVFIGLQSFTPLAFMIFLLQKKTQVYVFLHGIEAWKPSLRVRFFKSYVTSFLAVSEYTRAKFSDMYKVKVGLLQNVYSFNSALVRENIGHKPGTKLKLLFVGRLDAKEGYKGFEESLYALSRVNANSYSFAAVLHGDSVKEAESLSAFLGVKCDFHSSLSDDELRALYIDSNVFLMPSRGEGFGLVFLEAISNGCICIGCHSCGSSDAIFDEAGFLIDGSINSIYKTLIRLSNEGFNSFSIPEGYRFKYSKEGLINSLKSL